MKSISTLLLCLLPLIFQAQSKEDMLACLEVIMEQEDFQPAYENRGITGESLIIVANRDNWRNLNDFQKIRNSLTDDDFYGFSESVKIIQGDNEAIINQGYNPLHILNFNFSESNGIYIFQLFTVVENQNLNYNWIYKLVKNGEDWEIESRNVDKRKVR